MSLILSLAPSQTTSLKRPAATWVMAQRQKTKSKTTSRWSECWEVSTLAAPRNFYKSFSMWKPASIRPFRKPSKRWVCSWVSCSSRSANAVWPTLTSKITSMKSAQKPYTRRNPNRPQFRPKAHHYPPSAWTINSPNYCPNKLRSISAWSPW